MKPVSGSCSKGIKLISTPDNLSKADLLDSNNLSELVPSHWIEYTLDLCYSSTGNLLSCVPRQRLEVRGGIARVLLVKIAYFNILKSTVSISGAQGVLALQIFVDPSRTQFLCLEINPRFGGGYPMSHFAGVDFPGLLIKEHLCGLTPRYEEDWKSNLVLLRHDAMVLANVPNPSVIP